MRSYDIQTVLFDLDGTLIDHFRVIYRCYRFALEQMGLAPASFERVKATVGGGIRVTFSRLVPPEYVDEGVRLWREYYEQIWSEEIEILHGAGQLIEQLRRDGRQLAIFTNKEGESARKIADHLGWTPKMDLVVGRLDTEWTKPSRELTVHVLETLGADPATTIMVGDSPFDVDAGKAAGLRTYVVATGSHSAAQLAETPADGVFNDLPSLGRALFGDGEAARVFA